MAKLIVALDGVSLGQLTMFSIYLLLKLQGHTVKWFSDSQNAVSIVQYGSKRPHLQDRPTCISIFETCLLYSIKLEMERIPRSDYIGYKS